MADDGIVIRISGDPKDFEKAANDVKKLFGGISDGAKKESGVASAAWASFIGNFASQAAIGAIGLVKDAIGAVFGEIKAGISDSLEAEKAVQKFNLSLANTGKFSQETSEEFQAYADTIEKTTGLSEEAVLANASLIQSLGNLDSQGLKRATSAAADLSAAIGVDFDTASSLLAKASTGNVEALKKYGLQVEDTGNKAKDFESALSQIESRFGGSAAQSINTFAGQLQLAKNAYGDVFKEFGQSITETPALKGFATGLTQVFQTIQDLISQNKDVIQDFVSGGINLFIKGIGLLGESVALGVEGFGALFGVLTTVNTAILAIPEGVLRIGASFVELFTPLDKIIETFNALTGQNIPTLSEGFRSAAESIGEFRQFATEDAQAFEDSQLKKAEAIRSFSEGLTTTLQTNVEAARVAGEQENTQYLEQQTARAQVRNELQAEELASIQAFQAQVLAQSQGILAQSTIDEAKAATDKLINEGKFNEAKRALLKVREQNEKESIFAVRKFEELTQKEKIGNLKDTLGQIASLQSSGSKELFAIGKAAAIAGATIDGIAAVQKALSSAPPPFNFALAALVGVAQASNLAKIASASPPQSQGFAQGGLVTGGIPGIDSVPIVAQQGEIVAPPRSFDEVVEGTARQRGFVQGDENAGVIQAIQELRDSISNIASVTLQVGTLVADDNGINELADKLRDAVQFRGAQLA